MRTIPESSLLLDRLAVKYPNSPYAINALYEKGAPTSGATAALTIAAFRGAQQKYPSPSAVKQLQNQVYFSPER